jgi:hypothetical protein
MVNVSGSEKLLKNIQSSEPTYDDAMRDNNLQADIRCITSHDGVHRIKPGSFESIRYEKGVVMNRCNVVLQNDYWVMN